MIYGFIVEGTHDEEKVKGVLPDAQTVSCRGTVLNNAIKSKIDKLMNKADKVYILTDPDDAGDNFAKRLQENFPIQRIHLDAKQCEYHRGVYLKIGVEHASDKYLEEVFKKYNII